MADGRNEEALVLLGRALLGRPKHALALCKKGEALRRLFRFEEALEALGKSVAEDPLFAEAHRCRGEAHLALSRWILAGQDFDRALALSPNDVAARKGRGRVRLVQDDIKGALADFEHALRLDPHNAELLGLCGEARQKIGDLEGAETSYTSALDLDPSLLWIHARRGRVRLRLDQLEGALGDFSVIVAEDRNDAWALRQRGETHRRLGQLKEAIDDFSESLALVPDSAWALASRGVSYGETGRLKEAWADLSRSLLLDEAGAWARFHRALVLEQLGRHGLASEDLARVIEGDDSVDARALRARCRLATGDLRGAQADLEFALASEEKGIRPGQLLNRGDLHALHGEVLLALRNLGFAVNAFSRSLDAEPGGHLHSHTLMRRGVALRTLGTKAKVDFPELDAEADFSGAIDGGQGRALYERALLYQAVGALSAAESDITTLIEESPGGRFFRLRAELRSELGNHGGAAEDLHQAIEFVSTEDGFEAYLNTSELAQAHPARAHLTPSAARQAQKKLLLELQRAQLEALVETRSWNEALPLADTLIAAGSASNNSAWSKLHCTRGRVHAGYGNSRAAEEDFRLAIEGKLLAAHLYRGRLHYSHRRYTQAAADFEAALPAEREAALLELAVSKCWLSDDDARECLEAAMEVHGDLPRLRFARALLLGPSAISDLSSLEFDEATDVKIGESAELYERAMGSALHGALLAQKQELIRAEACFERAILLWPGREVARRWRYFAILCRLQDGDHEGATSSAAGFVEEDPSSIAHLARGVCAFAIGDHESARSHFRWANEQLGTSDRAEDDADRTTTTLLARLTIGQDAESKALMRLLRERALRLERFFAEQLLRAQNAALGLSLGTATEVADALR